MKTRQRDVAYENGGDSSMSLLRYLLYEAAQFSGGRLPTPHVGGTASTTATIGGFAAMPPG